MYGPQTHEPTDHKTDRMFHAINSNSLSCQCATSNFVDQASFIQNYGVLQSTLRPGILQNIFFFVACLTIPRCKKKITNLVHPPTSP